MTPDEIEEALTVAMEGVRELGASITLIPCELGLSDEEDFNQSDIRLLIDFLNKHFGEITVLDPGEKVVYQGENDGVQLYIETNQAGDIVFFFAPEGYEP